MQIRTDKDTVEGVICKDRKTQEDYFIKADCIVLGKVILKQVLQEMDMSLLKN